MQPACDMEKRNLLLNAPLAAILVLGCLAPLCQPTATLAQTAAESLEGRAKAGQENEQEPQLTAAEQAKLESLEKALASLKFESGTITLPGGKAVLTLPEGFRYLKPDDARKVLVDIWGNPPSSGLNTLGMVFPSDYEIMSEDGWAIVISYEESGYVSDEDADKINYDDLLKQLREESVEASKARESAGYGKFLLKGWALPPHYDKKAKVLHWAKSYETGAPDDALNYDMRVLGRQGVLSLNAVATADQAKMIAALGPQLINMATFTAGNTYAEFNPDTDKKADYTLAGLVVGGAVAAKVLAKGGLLVFLAKFGKFLILPVLLLIPWLKRKFTRSS
jgi:uncharacterized membrane-anchored protein